jgi:hypothetical protein
MLVQILTHSKTQRLNSAGALAIGWSALLCALEHFTIFLYICLRREADIRSLSPRQIDQPVLEVQESAERGL